MIILNINVNERYVHFAVLNLANRKIGIFKLSLSCAELVTILSLDIPNERIENVTSPVVIPYNRYRYTYKYCKFVCSSIAYTALKPVRLIEKSTVKETN